MSYKKRDKYFNRHLLRAGLQCSTKLHYKAHQYPEDETILPFLEHAGFNKHQLKKLAGLQFADGVLVNGQSKKDAAEITSGMLDEERKVLLDAAFIWDCCFAKVPVLIKEQRDITLIDIQTKAINPYKHRLVNHQGKLYKKWRPYIVDLVYKIHCMQQLHPQWNFRATLMLPDKTKKAQNDNLLTKLQHYDTALETEDLFYTLDVSELVYSMLGDAVFDARFGNNNFTAVLKHLKQLYFEGDRKQPVIGKKCGNCEFRISEPQQQAGHTSGFRECWKESDKVAEYTDSQLPVLDLIGPGVYEWMKNGVFLQKDVPLNELPSLESISNSGQGISQKQRQTLQVRQTIDLQIPPEIVKQPIFDELNRWQYPLHFLDFEAGNYAVPVRRGQSPYHLVVFQFSCHTLHADGRREHHQFISSETNDYPNYALVRRLKDVPAIEKGTIIQYSKFEHYALKTIRKELKREMDLVPDAPELVQWLNGMVQRHDSNHPNPPYLADLSRLVKSYYYNEHMGSSLSIKDVLQSILTVSDTLKEKYSKPYHSHNFDEILWWQWDSKNQCAQSPYQILRKEQSQQSIGRGTEAMVTYGKLLTNSYSEKEKETAIESLFKYCELDTLAMVMIYEHWKRLAINEGNSLC